MVSTVEAVFGWLGFGFNVIAANIIAHGLWSVYSKKHLIQWSARHFEQLYYALLGSIFFVLIERNIQLCGGILDLFELSFAARWCLNNVFGVSFLAMFLLRYCIQTHYPSTNNTHAYHIQTEHGWFTLTIVPVVL